MIIKNNKDEFASYLEDTSNISGYARKLYIPEHIGELIDLVGQCNARGTGLTISGGRTGTTGGCVPLEGVLVSLEKFNRIISLDTERQRVRAEAGIVLEALEEALREKGFTLRAQPTESLACLGGAIATSASGVRGYRYGGVREYVRYLKVILADGTVGEVTRGHVKAQDGKIAVPFGKGDCREIDLPSYRMPAGKHQAGYFVKDDVDLIDLFIGSEGTLGVIVEAELDIQKQAACVFDCIVFFEREADAFSFVAAVKEKKAKGQLDPTSLEFLDRRSLEFLKEEYPRVKNFASCVYFEEETDGEESARMNEWLELIETSGANGERTWFGDTPAERGKIFQFRHRLPQLINEFLKQHRQRKVSTDVAVPEESFSQMYEFYKRKGLKSGVPFVNFGHIGENHLHFNFLPRTGAEYDTAKEYTLEFIKKAIELGGTVSAEHGIGKLKKEYLALMYGAEAIGQMRNLKKQLDPNFILGRHNIFDCDL